MKTKTYLTSIFILLTLNLFSQDNLTFDVIIHQDSIRQRVENNTVGLHPGDFEFELKLPAYMLEFNGEKYSSVNYIATTSKPFFDSMVKGKCFSCVKEIGPYSFDKHNSGEALVIGTEGYSFWTISQTMDEHNVSSFKINESEIIAHVKIKQLFIAEQGKSIKLKKFKGTIYLIAEAVNRDSSAIVKRTYIEIVIK